MSKKLIIKHEKKKMKYYITSYLEYKTFMNNEYVFFYIKMRRTFVKFKFNKNA